MKSKIRDKFSFHFKRYLISGLLVWIPIWVTVIVIKFILGILDQTILLIPAQYRIPGMGVIITLCVILFTGFVAANYFGKKLVRLWDTFVARIPLVRTVHVGVKKMLKIMIAPEGQSFRKVVLVEFPSVGMWTIAFQIGECAPEIKHSLISKKLISLFVPMTPNITSGFLMMIPEKNVIELDMSVDQALKFVISLGVMPPQSENSKKK